MIGECNRIDSQLLPRATAWCFLSPPHLLHQRIHFVSIVPPYDFYHEEIFCLRLCTCYLTKLHYHTTRTLFLLLLSPCRQPNKGTHGVRTYLLCTRKDSLSVQVHVQSGYYSHSRARTIHPPNGTHSLWCRRNTRVTCSFRGIIVACLGNLFDGYLVGQSIVALNSYAAN